MTARKLNNSMQRKLATLMVIINTAFALTATAQTSFPGRQPQIAKDAAGVHRSGKRQ